MSFTSMHRQVLLLATAQALVQTAAVMVMTVGGLAGGQVAATAGLATAPIAAMFLGTALLTLPASTWMTRVGRRTGFMTGAMLGAAGGGVAAFGLLRGSLIVLCLGTMLVGMYIAFAQFYRFAAAEVSDDAFRPRAIAFVMAGGVVAALLGTWLARAGGDLFTPHYTGTFVVLGLVTLVALALLAGLKVPTPATAAASAPARPLAEIMRQPAYRVALFGAATGGGIMTLAMTATPIAMVEHHHGLDAAAMVIQYHVLGMYLPSFFTGGLIARFGVLQVMLAGVALLLGHVVLTLTGTEFPSFASALVLLGVGWNFLYVGGTALLTRTYTAAERGRAQAVNDLSIVLVSLSSSLGSGALLAAVGWQMMNVMLLPWLAAAVLALWWLKRSGHAGQPHAA